MGIPCPSHHLSGSCPRAAPLPWAITLLTLNHNFPCCTMSPLPLIPSLGTTRAWLHLLRTPSRNRRQQRDPPLSLLLAEEASLQTLLLCPMLQPQPPQSPPLVPLLSVTVLYWAAPDWSPSLDGSQLPNRGEGPRPWLCRLCSGQDSPRRGWHTEGPVTIKVPLTPICPPADPPQTAEPALSSKDRPSSTILSGRRSA